MNLKLPLKIIIIFALVLILPNYNSNASDFENFELSEKLINGGKYLEAIGVYKEISKTSASKNSKARALLFTGFIYNNYLDQPDTAINVYRSIIRIFPFTQAAPDAFINSGIIEFNKGEFKNALALFEQFKAKFPNNMRFNSAKAWAEASRNKLHKPSPKKIKKNTKPILPDEIKVLIISDKKDIVIGSEKGLSLFLSKRLIYKGKTPLKFSFKKQSHVISTISGKKINLPEFIKSGSSQRIILTLKSEANKPFSLNGKKYRGTISVGYSHKGFEIVNDLPLEEYLKGVVPCEMSYKWSFEALKAQAVASRTYACYIKQKNISNTFYDILSTTSSQVYGGMDSEKNETTLAVEATKGIVMTWNNRMIIAYFHANSGGFCEDPLNVWGAEVPYLKSVKDQYSERGKTDKWHAYISYPELTSKLLKGRKGNKNIKKILVSKRSNTGRAVDLKIYINKKQLFITANNFRLKLGPKIIRSSLFNITNKKNGVFFKGKGYGHGVGMSQWGAHQMGLAGKNYRAILKHYFKNIIFQRI